MKHHHPEIKPGKYPDANLEVLHRTVSYAIVRYDCCGKTANTKMSTLERHLATGRTACVQCMHAAGKKVTRATSPRRLNPDGDLVASTGVRIPEMVRAGRHDWWPMSGGMGR